jgi:hypothetical protein
MKLAPHGVCRERPARQRRPIDRTFAILDPLREGSLIQYAIGGMRDFTKRRFSDRQVLPLGNEAMQLIPSKPQCR